MPYRHNQNPNSKKSKKSRGNHPPRTLTHIHKLSDQPQYYDIKIGEVSFCLSPDSLRRDAPNFFTSAFFGYFAEAETTSIFIERDPNNFAMIVQYLRNYDVSWPSESKISMLNLIQDVKYYGFERLQKILEEIYEEKWPQKVDPWQLRTYAPETETIVAINLKDIEIERWNQEKLVYDVNPVIKVKDTQTDSDSGHESGGEESDEGSETNETNAVNETVNETNVETHTAAADASTDATLPPNTYHLEVHARDALATATVSQSKGIKFESFTFKDSDDDSIFRAITSQFRSSDSSLAFSPSLKLPFLKDACIIIDNHEYYDYNELSAYLGITSRGKPLYFEEAVIRIDNGAFLIRAKAWTYSNYYVKQPFVESVVA